MSRVDPLTTPAFNGYYEEAAANLYLQYYCTDSPDTPITLGKVTWEWQGGLRADLNTYGGIADEVGHASSEQPMPPY